LGEQLDLVDLDFRVAVKLTPSLPPQLLETIRLPRRVRRRFCCLTLAG
jgi:hypothetical protein